MTIPKTLDPFFFLKQIKGVQNVDFGLAKPHMVDIFNIDKSSLTIKIL